MRRSLLLTASVLGLLICMIGGTGLFAALTDSAHTGTNSVESTALPPSSDLQLASATYDPIGFTCGTYSDDLATGLYNVTNAGINQGFDTGLCIKNAGSAPVSLSAAVDQLTDVDFACTGDEADNGDTTCGNDAAGELAPILDTKFSEETCDGVSPVAVYGPNSLSALAGTPTSMGTLGAGEAKCFIVTVSYGTTASTIARQQSQSDRATWRFVFTGQA